MFALLHLKLSPPLTLDPGVDAVYASAHQVQLSREQLGSVDSIQALIRKIIL